MRHISVISRTPVVANSETENILQTLIDIVGFVFELLGALEAAFSTIAAAVLALKETSAE